MIDYSYPTIKVAIAYREFKRILIDSADIPAGFVAFVNDPPLVPNCENKFVVLKSKYVRDKVDDDAIPVHCGCPLSCIRYMIQQTNDNDSRKINEHMLSIRFDETDGEEVVEYELYVAPLSFLSEKQKLSLKDTTGCWS